MILLIIPLIACLLVVITSFSKKHPSPRNTAQHQQDDELVAVILPTVTKEN
ncbi:MAG: hypothetical protein U0451_01730 [Candidatus Saccharimonadales bacterium]